MIIAGLVISAVAVLLGIFTKLPQGGGGIVNNLMVMGCFLSIAPPFLPPPPPPPNAVIFDIDAAIFDPRKAYVHHHALTCNLTQDPMPQCHPKPRLASDPPPIKATFSIPTLSLPSLSSLLLMIGKAIANIAMIFMALSLSWLACTQLPLLAKIQKATDGSLATASVSGGNWAEIEMHHRLSYDLQREISERSKALAEVERVTRQAREESKKAAEKEREIEQGLEELKKELNDAVKERARGRGDLERLEKEKEEETERLKQEMSRQIKASEVKERVWEEKRAEEKKRYGENKESMKMDREKERESWKRHVERLKTEKEEEQGKLQLKIKKISEEREEEKKRLEKEKEEELRKQEKLEMEGEERWKSLEAQRLATSDALERSKNLAQKRIAELEEENSKLRNAAVESDKAEGERKAARAISEGERWLEKKRWEEQIAEAKKLVSKMQEDFLNGQKLIEDLQTDKRIDRQLLLELRAQLARPTHPSPLRFDETAYAVRAAPNVVPSSAPSNSSPQSSKETIPSSSPKIPPTALPSTLSSGKPVRPEVASPIVRLPPANPKSQPIVRLPPPPPAREENPSRLPTRSLAPVNAPRRPRGWRPNVPKPA